MRRAFLTAISALALVAGACGTASSQSGQLFGAEVYGSCTAVNQSSQTWTYKIHNTSTSPDYTVFLVQIEVDEQTDVVRAATPLGWTADTTFPHFVAFVCTGSDLGYGECLGGFDIEYSATPQYQNWSAMFNNVSDPYESPTEGGVVDTTAVPEPATASAMVFGLAATLWPRLKRCR